MPPPTCGRNAVNGALTFEMIRKGRRVTRVVLLETEGYWQGGTPRCHPAVSLLGISRYRGAYAQAWQENHAFGLEALTALQGYVSELQGEAAGPQQQPPAPVLQELMAEVRQRRAAA